MRRGMRRVPSPRKVEEKGGSWLGWGYLLIGLYLVVFWAAVYLAAKKWIFTRGIF